MAKHLSVSQKEARDLLRKGAIDYAAGRRRQGVEYKDIENELKAAGVVDHNGKPFHNANLSKGVADTYPELRKRKVGATMQVGNKNQPQVWAASADALRKLLKK